VRKILRVQMMIIGQQLQTADIKRRDQSEKERNQMKKQNPTWKPLVQL
jgi:hypothetical protein